MTTGHLPATALGLVALTAYLVVEAPAPLPSASGSGGSVPIEAVLRTVAIENNVVRALWTKEIVGAGKEVGLAFREDWRDRDVEAGPLPALFLREVATSLEKDSVRLSLFLGSDFPINPSNLFSDAQRLRYDELKKNGEPQFFFEEDTRLQVAMFPDRAVAQPCVTCHNEHPDSPKKDWKLDDIMGATTWTYPVDSVSYAEFVDVLRALHEGFHDAYSAYIAKVDSFSRKPEIGDRWPRDGYYLPSVDAFMAEAAKRASAQTLDALIATASRPKR